MSEVAERLTGCEIKSAAIHVVKVLVTPRLVVAFDVCLSTRDSMHDLNWSSMRSGIAINSACLIVSLRHPSRIMTSADS